MAFRHFFLAALVFPAALVAATTVPASVQATYWQCAAFARQFSGIEIRGDAWTWWGQAEGRYAKGRSPRVGAVMAFVPGTHAMRLGHVATVTHVLADREIAVTHANWSPINGSRGQIERDVRIRDVSQDNDWSRVRVFYAPLGDLGATAWGVDGFIYPNKVRALDTAPQMASAEQRIPRLGYARLDTLVAGEVQPSRLRLGGDVIRLAQLESRRGL